MAHQAVAVALASFKKLCSAASLVSMSAISADASPCFAIGGLTSAFAGLASEFSLAAMSASLFLTSRKILPGDDATALVRRALDGAVRREVPPPPHSRIAAQRGSHCHTPTDCIGTLATSPRCRTSC